MPAPHKRAAFSLLGLSLLVLVGIWVLLPARYLPIDLTGSALGALCGVAGVSLLRRARFGLRLCRVACWATLVLGAATCSALAFVAAHLSGLYGPVGAGGALLLSVVVLLVLPYLVGLPALQLSWLRDTGQRTPE